LFFGISVKVLLTGATGFLGRHIAASLLNQSGVNLTMTGRNASIAKKLPSEGAKIILGDLRNPQFVAQLMSTQSFDTIVHCAALSSLSGRYEDFFACNVLSTRFLAQAALTAGVRRFVHISSPSLYFDGSAKFNIREDSKIPERGVNHYIQTKSLAEKELRIFAAQGLSVVMLRPRAVFGPHDTAILPRLLRVASKGFFPLVDHGRALVDITYVDNVVQAVELVLLAEDQVVQGKIYNVTNADSRPIGELLPLLFTSLGYDVRLIPIPLGFVRQAAKFVEMNYSFWPFLKHKEPPISSYSVHLIGVGQTLDISAIQQDLGYVPKVSLEDGFAKLKTWVTDANATH
jgi:nucleoside-diphosphate-sugar epimerase